MFMLPPRSIAPSARKAQELSQVATLRQRIVTLGKQAADLMAAASDYTYDYEGWDADEAEIRATLNAARHILSEMVEVSPQITAIQSEAQALYDVANDVSSDADSIDDMAHEITQLTNAVAQLTEIVAELDA